MFRKLNLTIGMLVLFGVAALPAAAQFGYVGFHGDGFGIQIGGPIRHHERRFRRPVCPPPVHIHSACCTTVTPGHYECVTKRVWREGYDQCVDYPAEFVTRYDACGRPVRVCVRPARTERVRVPGCWETVTERVWVQGYTTYSCGY